MTGRVDVQVYGENTIGRPEYGERVWIRRDIYRSNVTGETSIIRRYVDGPRDYSAAHCISTRYAAACACCWLGFSHSVEHHAALLAASSSKRQ